MYVESIIKRFQMLGDAMAQYGARIILMLVVLIAGLILVRWIDKYLRRVMLRLMPGKSLVNTISHTVYVLMVAIVIAGAATEFGAQPINVLRLMSIVALTALGLIIFLRPFLMAAFRTGDVISNTASHIAFVFSVHSHPRLPIAAFAVS